mgnify:CR=1 FL=1|tara:strand:- start:42830 stop:43846 length:1017 start_codon:yes stop_codon:yes gene_type:complete
MKISASIYSNKKKSLQSLIKELDQLKIDMFHVDFNDKKINIEKIKNDIIEIRKISKIPIDLHIISKTPSLYDAFLEEYKIEFVTYQEEDIIEKFTIPKIKETSFGISFVSKTRIENFEKYFNACDFVLLMTTIPGESGGKFNSINFNKIRKFKLKYPTKSIHIDGGVNDEIAFILRTLGVKSVVSGSFLVKNNILNALQKIKSSVINSEFKIKEFMIPKDDSPIVIKEETNFYEILKTIDIHKYGFVFIENKKGKFEGVISMADIRKCLIKNFNIFEKINADKLINNNPITIKEEDNITTMIKSTQNHNFPISFMPVLNNNNNLVGTITFFNLINSES